MTVLAYSLILMFLSPILGLLYNINNLTWRYRKWGLIFFITIFGTVYQFPEEADAARHQQNVYNHYLNLPLARFAEELYHIIILSPLPGTKGDVYIHVLSYLLGGVFGLPQLFFPVVSFIFAYFYITALSKILLWNKDLKKPLIFIALIFILVIYRGIDNINTVRTWTGTWILFNGVFGYLQTKQKKYLFLMLLAPMVHAAYFVMALPAYAVIFIKRFPPTFFVLIYAASFFITLNSSIVLDSLKSTDLGKDKVDSYYIEDNDPRLARREELKGNWYTALGKAKSLHWGSNALAITLILTGLFSREKMNKLELGLFSTGLMMAAFANFGDFISAFYNRTMINAGLYVLVVVVLLLIRGELFRAGGLLLLGRKILLWGSIFLFIPHTVYTISSMLYFTSVYMVALPFIGWFFGDLNLSLRELLNWIL